MNEIDVFLHQKLDSVGWQTEALVRLLLAAIAGALVGIEREVRGRQAGFRTNILVAVGSALVMIVSARMAYYDWPIRKDVVISVDPSRIAYGIMTGIGFLGAGIIVKTGGGVRGLTTAAALWCVAAAGMAAGQGLYVITFLASLIVLSALWLLDHMEDIVPKTRYRTIIIRTPWSPGCITRLIEQVQQQDIRVRNHTFRRTPDLAFADVTLDATFISRGKIAEAEERLSAAGPFELLGVEQG